MSARLIRLAWALMVWFILFHPSTLAQPNCVARASRPPGPRDGHPFAALRAGSARVLWRERDAPATAGETPALHTDDPVLRAMQKELERSKSQLKLEQMAAPYYIDYRVADMEWVHRGGDIWRPAHQPPHALPICACGSQGGRLQAGQLLRTG